MDNADEIISDDSNLTHKEVALFLGDELKSQNNENVVTYNLVEEYAKTAKHKKKFVWLLLGICFFIVGASTFTTIALLSNSNHKISINIDSFDDLNLRSLLNSVSHAQTMYENAVKNKETLEQNRSDELNQALQKKQMDLFTLQSVANVATKKSITARKVKIDSDYAETIKAIHAKYDAKIEEAESEIKKFKSQVNAYDSEKVSIAKDAESSINSTKQLHDIEMKNQQKRYEKQIKELHEQLLSQQIKAAEEQKAAVEEVRSIYQAKIDLLDPKAREQSSAQDKIILDAGIRNQTASKALWHSVENLEFRASNYSEKTPSPSESYLNVLDNTEKELTELRTIAYRFQPIPMENSIKDYVPAMIHQSFQIADSLAKTSTKMQADLNAFESLIEKEISESADGIILSTDSSPVFSVYIKKASHLKISSETENQVQILNGSKHLADGILSKSDGNYIVTQILPEEKNMAKIYQPVTGDRIKIIPQPAH